MRAFRELTFQVAIRTAARLRTRDRCCGTSDRSYEPAAAFLAARVAAAFLAATLRASRLASASISAGSGEGRAASGPRFALAARAGAAAFLGADFVVDLPTDLAGADLAGAG